MSRGGKDLTLGAKVGHLEKNKLDTLMVLGPQPKIIDSISVREFYESFREPLKMKLVAGENGIKHLIRDKSLNRPALALTGFYKYFANKRLQIFGAGEMGYLRNLSHQKQVQVLKEIVRKNVPCMIITRNLAPTKAMVEVCSEYDCALIRSPLTSRDFVTTATILLEERFAPRISEHGTMLDIKGIGCMIRGHSGVGKSECALALIERGHSLVADDLVHIRMINERELMAASSPLNRGYMECRGIGIINIAELFGIRSIRIDKRIDLVVTFIEWAPGMEEERTGLEQSYYNILDIPVPHMELPVRPGRDMARLVEVAAMVQALKKAGHDSAKEFNERLIAHMTSDVKNPL